MSRILGPHASRCLHDAAGTEILRNGASLLADVTSLRGGAGFGAIEPGLGSVLFGAGLAALGLTAAFGRPTGFATGFATGLAGPFAAHEELEENKAGENSGMSSARGITGTPALETP